MANNISSSDQIETYADDMPSIYPNTYDVNQVPDSVFSSNQSYNFNAGLDNSYLLPSVYSMYSFINLPVLSRQSPTSSTVTGHLNGVYNAEICTDLRSAEKCLDLPLNNKYLLALKQDTNSAQPLPAHFNTSILSKKRLSDPQIRHLFYSKEFEVATHFRKYSLTHCEIYKNAMPNINEQESLDRDDDSCNNYSTSENQHSSNGISSLICSRNETSGLLNSSSGRDITKLLKLKIRISDELGRRVKSSFDDSDDNSDSGDWFDDYHSVDNIYSHIKIDPFQMTNVQNKNLKKCHKCGHKLIKKQFTNSFI